MKNCTECGKELRETTPFCEHCGGKAKIDFDFDDLELDDLELDEMEDEALDFLLKQNNDVLIETKKKIDFSQFDDVNHVLEQLYVCYETILAIGVTHDELMKKQTALDELMSSGIFNNVSISDLETFLARTDEKILNSILNRYKNSIIVCFVLLLIACFICSNLYMWVIGTLVFLTYCGITKKKIDAGHILLGEIVLARSRLFELTEDIPVLQENVKELEQELRNICKEETTLFMEYLLPNDFSTLEAVGCFITYFENKRVHSLKEAIDIYNHEKSDVKNKEMLNISCEKYQMEFIFPILLKDMNGKRDNVRRKERMIINMAKINKEIRFANAMAVVKSIYP